MSQTLYCADIVLHGDNLEPLEKGAVLVEDGVIRAVAAQQDFDGFLGGQIFRPVIMPGLIDCHAHMALDSEVLQWYSKVGDPEAEHVLRALAAMQKDLKSGVTTSRYMGDKYFIDVAIRNALRDGRLFGPRALIATRGVKASHAHGLVGHAIDGVEERRAFMRENIAHKPDWLKLFITDTVLRPVLHCYPSRAEIAVAVEEAHNTGIPVAAHVAGGVGWDICIEEGVDSFEHGYFISERQLDALIRADRWLDLTPTPIMSEYYAQRCAPEMSQSYRDSREALARSMAMVVRSGAKYAVGSDGLHGFLANDIQYLVDFGATRREALRAATIHGARLCRVDDVTGSIVAGKCADFIGLESNPLDGVDALRNVTLVVREGRAVRLED